MRREAHDLKAAVAELTLETRLLKKGMIEGELVENDGAVCRPGDFVLLKKGTQHTYHAPNGCLLALYIDSLEKPK